MNYDLLLKLVFAHFLADFPCKPTGFAKGRSRPAQANTAICASTASFMP